MMVITMMMKATMATQLGNNKAGMSRKHTTRVGARVGGGRCLASAEAPDFQTILRPRQIASNRSPNLK